MVELKYDEKDIIIAKLEQKVSDLESVCAEYKTLSDKLLTNILKNE